MKSPKTWEKWAESLTIAAVNVIFKMWDEQNKQLNNTDTIHDLSGKPALIQSITQEYSLGLGGKLGVLYEIRVISRSHILDKSLLYQKIWLCNIWQGCQMYNDIIL